VGEHHCRKDAIGFEAVQATGDEPLDPIRNQIGRFGVGEKMVIAADLVVAVGEKPLKLVPEQEAAQLAPMRTDTYIGMAFSNLIAFFIILDAGAVLYVHGGRDIRSATQAVEALRPLASEMAFLLFSIGMHWDHQDRFTCGAGSGEFGCICARRNAEMAHRAR
jgi:hypothetical protein